MLTYIYTYMRCGKSSVRKTKEKIPLIYKVRVRVRGEIIEWDDAIRE